MMWLEVTIITVGIVSVCGQKSAKMLLLAEAIEQMTIHEQVPVIDFISDFSLPDQSLFLESLLRRERILVSSYTLPDLWRTVEKHRETERCPVMVQYSSYDGSKGDQVVLDSGEIFKRSQVYPKMKQKRLLLFWLSTSSSVVLATQLLGLSILNCEQHVDMGMMHHENRIMFVTEGKYGKDELFGAFEIQRHPRVSLLQMLPDHDSFILFRSWGVQQFVKLKKDEDYADVADKVFRLPSTFGQKLLRHGCNPYSYFIQADPKPGGGENEYQNYQGYEVELMGLVRDQLGFQLEISSPPEYLWGNIDESNGTWMGMVGALKRDEVDVISSCMTANPSRGQVMDFTVGFEQDFWGWVSPKPTELPTYLSAIRPLDPYVWLLIILCLGIVAPVILILATQEDEILEHVECTDFDTLNKTYWYCFGTLIGEAITRDTATENYPALRFLLGTWILFCMIVGASYGGNLKSYLTTPSYTAPLHTTQAVAESSFGLQLALFGEEEEVMMEKSVEPYIAAMWKKKEVVEATSENLASVYAGKTVYILWASDMRAQVFMKYSSVGSPDTLIDMSPNPIFSAKSCLLGLNKLSPWNQQIKDLVGKIMEAGLVDRLRLKTLLSMRNAMISTGELPVKAHSVPSSSPLSVENFVGTFLIAGVMLGIAAISFFLEARVFGSDKKKDRDNIELERQKKGTTRAPSSDHQINPWVPPRSPTSIVIHRGEKEESFNPRKAPLTEHGNNFGSFYSDPAPSRLSTNSSWSMGLRRRSSSQLADRNSTTWSTGSGGQKSEDQGRVSLTRDKATFTLGDKQLSVANRGNRAVEVVKKGNLLPNLVQRERKHSF